MNMPRNRRLFSLFPKIREDGSGRAFEAYFLFPLFAALMISVIWVALFYFLQSGKEAVERAAATSARESADIYEAQMIRNLDAIDQTLKTIKFAYEFQGKKLALAELKEKGLLPPTLVFNVSIVARTGEVIANTHSGELKNVSGQPYFLAHQAHDTTESESSLTKLTAGAGKLQFSRRLNAHDGSFAGIAIVMVDAAYFTSGYENSKLGNNGVLGIVGEDGVFLSKRTGDEIAWGEIADMASREAGLNAGSAPLVNAWDGIERYTQARQLYRFPLTVIVGLSRAEQFEGFQQQRSTYLWAAAATSLLLAAAAAMMSRLSWDLAMIRKRTRKDQETYYAASEATLDAVFVLHSLHDDDGHITDFALNSSNERGARIFRKSKAELLGRRVSELLPPDRFNSLLGEFEKVVRTGVMHEHEWENSIASVQAKWLYRQVVRVEDGVVVIVRDITERRQAEERISHMAHHDALTGLPNRTLLEDRIRQAISYAQRYGRSMMVVFIDLDNFKLVNDSLGHKAGDELLKTTAQRMLQCIRQTDTVIRLGGDEFVIVLVDQSEISESLTTVLQRIRNAIAEPIFIEGQKLEVTSSMGLAIYPDDGMDCSTLLLNADAAMYQAKMLGRNNYQFYTSEINAKIHEKLALQEGLRKAVARNEFFLEYQPQVDLRSNRIIGAEALIRWQCPERGVIPPQAFIEAAEEAGLIAWIGEWVLFAACRQNKAWQDAGMPPLVISVNISARQFKENILTGQVAHALKESGLEARYLELELTESLIMQDVPLAISTMQELHAMGVRLSIDDFGSGYSSLSELVQFPIVRLKIDGAFIDGLPEHEENKAVSRSVISLAHAIGLKVLAEGVETAEQISFLKKNECDEIQGRYFCGPVPPQEIEKLVRMQVPDDRQFALHNI
jgi:diguanylate cyclase (GGDEF)-like protein/PAS domain S-box-containing protein